MSQSYADGRHAVDNKINVQIKKLKEDAVVPKYAHDTDAGFDLVASEKVAINSGETKIIPTGLAMAIPEGYEIQIRPRSGITVKTQIRVQLGTIDCSYRGEIGIIADNRGKRAAFIQKGDRIAQAVLNRVPQANFQVVEELDETERGQGGFGSSGVKS